MTSPEGRLVPEEIDVQLTWNGAPQDWVTYETTGHQPGDSYVLAAQVDKAVAESGLYPWSLHVVMKFGDDQPDFNAEVTGTARVVVNDAPAPDPDDPFAGIDFFGAGWGIAGVDRLDVGDGTGDVLWVTGTGDSEAFTRNPDGSFTDPPDEFGTLKENDDHTYTYTATDQTRYEFNKLGLLTEIVAPDGVETIYEYNDQGQLEQVTAPDGGVTTFEYDPDTLLLESITEPGDRELHFDHEGGTLTQITDVDGSERTFSYDGSGRMTGQQWGPLNADESGAIDETYTYDAHTGALTEVDDGDGTVYQITAQAAARWNPRPPFRPATP